MCPPALESAARLTFGVMHVLLAILAVVFALYIGRKGVSVLSRGSYCDCSAPVYTRTIYAPPNN